MLVPLPIPRGRLWEQASDPVNGSWQSIVNTVQESKDVMITAANKPQGTVALADAGPIGPASEEPKK